MCDIFTPIFEDLPLSQEEAEAKYPKTSKARSAVRFRMDPIVSKELADAQYRESPRFFSTHPNDPESLVYTIIHEDEYAWRADLDYTLSTGSLVHNAECEDWAYKQYGHGDDKVRVVIYREQTTSPSPHFLRLVFQTVKNEAQETTQNTGSLKEVTK